MRCRSHRLSSGRPACEHLDLADSGITDVLLGAFQGMNFTTALFLDSNSLRSLQARAFEGLGSLRLLSVNNNKVGCAKPDAAHADWTAHPHQLTL
jgi:hypothetical protein